MMNRLLLYPLGFLFSCSQLFWRPASLPLEQSPGLQSGTSLELQVFYEEKDAWNPLAGTTDKRHYRTQFTLKNQGQVVDSWETNSWVLGEDSFFEESMGSVWLQGSSEVYGTYPRQAYFRKNQVTRAGESNLFQILPSPDGQSLAIAKGEAQGNFHWEIRKNETVLVSGASSLWMGYPLTAARWLDQKLYVRQGEEVLVWSPGDSSFRPAKTFPKCFVLPTAFGKFPKRQLEMVSSVSAIEVCL